MASLYELTMDAKLLQDLLESGEIDEETFNDTLESLDVDTKIENICKVIRNLESDAKAFKEEKDRLQARQKTAENGVKRLKDSLLNYLSVTETKKVTAGNFNVSMRTSESVNITNPDVIDENWLQYLEPKIDVAGIKTAIKNGEKVAGAELVKNPYVMIR